jgi:hypothetical protein
MTVDDRIKTNVIPQSRDRQGYSMVSGDFRRFPINSNHFLKNMRGETRISRSDTDQGESRLQKIEDEDEDEDEDDPPTSDFGATREDGGGAR